MGMMKKFSAADAKLNMVFSAPVFFDDGKNMFLAEGKTIKPYHMAAIKRWNLRYLLTSGHTVALEEGANIARMAGFDKKKLDNSDAQDVEELEELEEI